MENKNYIKTSKTLKINKMISINIIKILKFAANIVCILLNIKY